MKTETSENCRHLQKGQLGEAAAAQYLEQKGWQVIERNWRTGHMEIDLIAWDTDKTLVFVEVKTRSAEAFSGPEGAVHLKKQLRLARAASRYMELIGYEWIIRFDVLAIILNGLSVKEIRHHEDAFFPGATPI